MARVDEKIPARKKQTEHAQYHKHEQGVVRSQREAKRTMKRVGWQSVEKHA
uniref:Uncharacterized protein n=1 Tax=Pseudomonas phage Ulina01 TaxID=3138549 RepID=A0AAU6W0P2_9CAUD